MGLLLQGFPAMGNEDEEYLRDVAASITRKVIFIIAFICLFIAYLLGASDPVHKLTGALLAGTWMILVSWLALSLLDAHPFLARLLWQVGLLLNVLLAQYFFRQVEFNLVLLLLPFLAAVTDGWFLALLAQALLGGALLFFFHFPDLFPLTPEIAWVSFLGGALIAGIVCIAKWVMLSTVQQSIAEARQARARMNETRLQRVELIQTQEDLVHANRELARLTQHLKALTQVAEEARRVKEEFVANVSHELRTPLNMIIGFSELITKAPRVYGDLSPTLLADITAIQRNSQHLSDLVNDVLDLSQIEAGRMTLVKDWTSLQELAETAVSAVKVLYDTKGLYLNLDLPAEPLRIFCDRTRIREVLLNLLSNAGRFTERGGVWVRAHQEHDTINVCVTDTGPGISPENQAILFEPFQQIDTSIRRKGGSGLGLSISKRFVEMHNGKMWLESTLGEGTSFYFSLPVAQPVANFIDISASRRWITPYTQYEVDRPHRSKAPLPVVVPRFILLDKGSSLQRLFNRYLGDVEIVSVDSFSAAQQELNRSPAHGLIVNGATADQEVEQMGLRDLSSFATPLLTCWISGDDEVTRKLGVDSYLLKPVSREKLLATLHRIGREIHTVLLVDDDLEVLQLFARILNSAERNYVVLRAKNGVQALEILRERHPDVMLIDLVMPEMDGFQVLREKARDESIRDIPVVVVSSKDPTGAPIVSDHLNVLRKGGLSARELLLSIEAISKILTPDSPAAGPAQPAEQPG
jgi:signal transduction histidine kinase/CheY-like chemotaxis protein